MNDCKTRKAHKKGLLRLPRLKALRPAASMASLVMPLCVAQMLLCGLAVQASAQDWSLSQNPSLERYFEHQVTQVEEDNELTQYETLEDWQNDRPKLRKQLFDMLGLDPLPERSELQVKLTGTTEHPEFIVERLHFQSMPGLYVTANLYRPRRPEDAVSPSGTDRFAAQQESETYPTILYVCGHAKVTKDGISYGNKAYYQHHGAWFARNGYVCLTIDTVQRGEIEGVHHGTYRHNRWWWNSRGYTPAGLEAWNCIRALDYLESRSECDMQRVGVTGRSGGGIYSWWLAALDDRVHCVVPVAGITSMRDQVMRGCIEGHCDCMFMLNTNRWNFAKIAAMVAPRPLLLSNTDKDRIFPLEGVVDVHRQVRHIYRLYGATEQLGLQITEGPHADTQELHIHAFRWFNRFLKGDQSLITKAAEKFFAPELLKVFETLPTDETNSRIDEQFVPAANVLSSESILQQQETLHHEFQERLLERCFRAWPAEPDQQEATEEDVRSIEIATTADGDEESTRLSLIEFDSEPFVSLRLEVQHPSSTSLEQVQSANLVIALEPSPLPPISRAGTPTTVTTSRDTAVARLVVRPGSKSWNADERKLTHIRRRFQLLGTTLESQQIWDIRRGLQTLRDHCPNLEQLTMTASPGTESLVLLASLFESPVDCLIVPTLPTSNRDLPSVLNLTRTIPEGLLPILAARRSQIITKSPPDNGLLLKQVTNDAKWTGRTVLWSAE